MNRRHESGVRRQEPRAAETLDVSNPSVDGERDPRTHRRDRPQATHGFDTPRFAEEGFLKGSQFHSQLLLLPCTQLESFGAIRVQPIGASEDLL